MPVLKFNNQNVLANPEPVGLQRPTAGGWGAITPIATACRYPVSTRELARSNGRYQSSDVTWTMNEDEVGDQEPAQGWRVIDANGNRFMVMEATHSVMGSFWKLVARNRVVVHNLRDLISIFRGNLKDTVDREGRLRHQTPVAVYANQTCAIQLQDRGLSLDLGVPQLDFNYEIYTEEQLDVSIGDEVRVIAKPSRPSLVGRIFEITAVHNPDAIEVLPSLLCASQGARYD